MVKWCAVIDCTRKIRGNKAFSFPAPGLRRDKWAKFCAQPNEWIPGPRSRICQHHFKPEDLLGTDKHIVPKSFAVPSIIEPRDQAFKGFQESESEMSEYEEQKMQEVHEEIKRVYNDPLLPTKNAENSQKKRLKLQQLKKKSCRACLHETPASFISLYAKYKGEYVAQMLSFCTNLEVDRNDDLPKFICDECFKKLKYAKELKDVCIQSDLLLRSENIKQEDFEEVNGFDFEELIEYKDESDSIQRAPPKQKKSLEKIVVETGVPAANSNIFLIQESKPKENRQEVQNLRPIILPKSSESTNRKPNLIISSNRLKIQIQNSTVFQEFEETTGRTRNVLNKPRQMVKKAQYSGQLEETDDTEDRVPNLPPKVRQLECVDCKKLYNADVDHKCAGKKTCSICEIQVESSSQLSKHLNVFHVSDRECRVCQFKLTSAKNLHYHLRTHMPGCSFICDVCGNVYCSRNRLRIHRNHHFDSHTCDICGIIVKTRGSIIRHMTFVHLKNHEKIVCPECGLSFNNIQRLQQHQMRKHDAPSNIQCDLCGVKFVYPSSLKNHNLLKHQKIQPYSVNELQTGAYSCDICSKTFKLHSFLIRHKEMHALHKITDGPLSIIKRFKCDLCFKMFKFRNTKEEHQRSHSSEKNFKCELCNKPFKMVTTLRKHLKNVHLQIRPYVSSKPNNVPGN